MIRTIILAAAIVGAATIVKESIMALGRETAAALEELRTAIANEASESSTSDADTAAAIRAQLPNVADIVGTPTAQPDPADDGTVADTAPEHGGDFDPEGEAFIPKDDRA